MSDARTNGLRHIDAHLQEKLDALPAQPGSYIFKDGNGSVLYVGKAVSLRSRVRSYFQRSASHSVRIRRMVRKIADIEWIVTDTELEALVLECNLIKRYRPPYNIRLRDDKHYPFLCFTLSEPFPRLMLTRRVKNDGNRYFGPYPSSKPVYETIDVLNRLFRICTCSRPYTGQAVQRACLYYHMGRCPAPCAGLADREEYSQSVKEVLMFLEGRHDRLLKQLETQMEAAAEALEFERAAALRDQIRAVRQITEHQKVLSSDLMDRDVLAYVADEEQALVQMFFIRGGKLIGQQHFMLEGASESEQHEAVQDFIKQYYQQAQEAPAEIVLPTRIEEARVIEQWLQQQHGHRVQLIAPQRGDRKRLLELATSNATLTLAQLREQHDRVTARSEAILLGLQQHLGLPAPPRRIEAYDISHFQGAATVGVMVVMHDAAPAKSQYRRFAVKSVNDAPDDFASMREVIGRRLAEYRKGAPKFSELPALMVIDGGKGQLNAALEAMREAGVDIPAIGLAKRFEEIYLPGNPEPLLLPADSPELRLLQQIRDEAHRFAIDYHRRLRAKRATFSLLDEVPGVGPVRKRALIKAFGSIGRLAAADVDAIAQVPGITVTLAHTIRIALDTVAASSVRQLEEQEVNDVDRSMGPVGTGLDDHREAG